METARNDRGERLEGAEGQPDTRCSGRVVYSGGPWPEAARRGGRPELDGEAEQ